MGSSPASDTIPNTRWEETSKQFSPPREWLRSIEFVTALVSRFLFGVVAQLGERLNGIQEVRSSILLSSTSFIKVRFYEPFFVEKSKSVTISLFAIFNNFNGGI